MSTPAPLYPVAVVDQLDGPVVTVEITPVGERPVLLGLPLVAVPGAREGRAYRLVPVGQPDPGCVTVACARPECAVYGRVMQIYVGLPTAARACLACGKGMTRLDPDTTS